MKIIVGLGNPGEKYQFNRHNVGFMVVDAFFSAERDRFSAGFAANKKFMGEVAVSKEVILLKPSTFMNESGQAVSSIQRFYKVSNEDLYIVHDDLDITLGNYKIQFGKGPQIHNGLLSVEEQLGNDQFWNVRFGVENREVRGNKGVPGVVYSLQDFLPTETDIVQDVTNKIVDELRAVIF